MATSATAVGGFGGTGHSRAWDIIAAADADTTLQIAHGITFADTTNDPGQRCKVTMEPRGAKFYTQNWIVASVDSTNINLTKTSTAGSTGDAASQCRVHLSYESGPNT